MIEVTSNGIIETGLPFVFERAALKAKGVSTQLTASSHFKKSHSSPLGEGTHHLFIGGGIIWGGESIN